MSNLLSHLRATLGGSGEPDAALLARFRDARDESAFAELVRRHAPAVSGVCRRALGDGPDAEDALQACFLVLAARVEAAGRVGNLGGWLHRVACLTANKARARRARRRAREVAVAELPDRPAPPSPDAELGRVVDEELARLPEPYRTAVVLCHLHGRTVDEAAAELGCPRGTVASRLARGRASLAKRLLRRGLGVAGLAVAAPRLPAAACARVVCGVFGVADGTAARLSREVLRAMSGTRTKVWAVGAMVLAAVAGGGLVRTAPPARAAPVPEVKAKPAAAELDRVRVNQVGAALACPTIRRQLDLTAGQQAKLDEAWADEAAKLKAAIARRDAAGAGDPASLLDTFNGMDEVVRAFDERAAGVLTADQLRRLRQVQLQRDGAAALLSRHAVRALRLTPAQEDGIAAAAAEMRTTGAALLNIEMAAGTPDTARDVKTLALLEQIRSRQGEEFERVMAAALKHLTAEQAKAWAELTGDPVPAAELLRSASPLNDPRFMRLATGPADDTPQPPVAPPAK